MNPVGGRPPGRLLLDAMFLCTLVLAAGCAGTGRSQGVRLLERRQYAEAVEALRAESAAHPDDAFIQRDLGVALLESGRPSDAVTVLRKVRVALPRDPQTAFHLGRACEKTEDFEGALAAYRDYLALGGRGRDEVAARLQAVSLRKIERETRELLAREDSLATAEVPANTIAIPDYANPAKVDSLEPLGRGLAAMLISDLERVSTLRILERARLRVLLDELGLAAPAPHETGATAPAPEAPITTPEGIRQRLSVLPRPSTGQPYLAAGGASPADPDAALREALKAFQSDEGLTADGIAGAHTRAALELAWERAFGKTAAGTAGRGPSGKPVFTAHGPPPPDVSSPKLAPRLGRLLGARRFIQGAFIPLPQDQVQLDASIIEASTGAATSSGQPVGGELRNVLQLQKELLHEILASLGIELTPDERRRLDALPTRDFLAFLAYSRGLELEDQGRTADAAGAYREATRRDPGFEAATARLRITAVTPAAQERLDTAEVSRLAQPESMSPDQVLHTATWTGIGPGPEGDRTDDLDPSLTDTERQDAEPSGAIIVIDGNVPGGQR